MPYLSRIPLNPLRSGAQRLLRSPQAMHAAVAGGTPTPGDRSLWRDEVRSEGDGRQSCSVLVLTQTEPDWSHVIEQAGWSTGEGQAFVRDLRPLLDLITVGRQFGFRVRANPVQSVRHPEHPTPSHREAVDSGRRERGIRVGHRSLGHQLAWFARGADAADARWGFSVADPDTSVSVASREHISFIKGHESRHRVTLDRVTFEGVLTVTDADRLRQVVLGGLGGAKAYGCGLLTLAPA